MIVALACAGATAMPAAADDPVTPQAAAHLLITPQQAQHSLQSLATQAVDLLPRLYQGDKDWGETKKVWAGVKIRREGLELKTHRRFRELRHGRWTRYQLTLPPVGIVDADGSLAPRVVVEDVHQLTDGRWQIRSTIVAPMGFEARVERWNMGVQWYSVSVSGDVRVRLHATTTIGFYADYSEIPPALVVDPRIEAAELVLERFEVDRISKIGGDVAEEIGEFLEEVIRDRVIRRENQRLTAKLNQAIEKRREVLRWSLNGWLTGLALKN